MNRPTCGLACCDPLASAVLELSTLLKRIPLSFELTNGHLEKELKILVAAALRGAANAEREPYLSVRDKKLNGAEIDLLALRKVGNTSQVEPAFWAELKCNFLESGADAAFNVATQALAQAYKYSEKLNALPEAGALREQLLGCPVYIVHFLNSMPAPKCGLPEAILEKFRRNRCPSTPEQLEDYYRTAALQHERQSQLRDRLESTPEERAKKRLDLGKRISDAEYAIKMTARLNASSIIHVFSEPELYALVTRYRAPVDPGNPVFGSSRVAPAG